MNPVERAAQPSTAQIHSLLNFLEKNPSLVKGFSKVPSARDAARKSWEKLALQLNSLGGCVKTWKQWTKYWADKKCAVKKKSALRCRSKTGGGNVVVELSEIEERIFTLMRVESFATGDRHLVNRPFFEAQTEKSSENSLSPVPIPMMIKNEFEGGGNFPESQFFDFQLIVTETDEEDTVEVVQTTTSDSIAQKELPEASTSNRIQCNTPSQPPKPPIVRRTSTIASQSPATSETTETSVPELNLNPRQNIAEQRDSIRKELLAIVNSNAESMQMLAAATKVQAEASKMHAEVAKVQAETTLLLAQAINKTGDTLVHLINKN